jgi:hypothetical protein
MNKMVASMVVTGTMVILAPFLVLSILAPAQVYAELQLLSTHKSFALNGTQSELEVRFRSDQSAVIIQSVMMSVNGSNAESSLSVSDIRVNDHLGNRYSIASYESVPQPNGTSQVLGNYVLPLALPAGGSLGVVAHIINPQQESALDVTIVYITNNKTEVSIESIPLGGMPFDVIANHESIQIEGSATGEEPIMIENTFVDPEIHCESCTRVEFQPSNFSQVDVAYVSNTTDLSSSDRVTFWVMGEGDVVFNVAGRNIDGHDISYAKTLQVRLGDDWRRVEIDLSGENLDAVTHLFGFSMDGATEQTFYLKGISYD